MTFIQALQTLRQKLTASDTSIDIDDIALHAIFEDIVLEQVADLLDEETIDTISEMDTWADIESTLQNKVSNYDDVLEKSIAQAVDEFENDTLEA